MIKRFVENIKQKPERHKQNWALGMSITLSLLILVSFAFYKGYLSFGSGGAVGQSQSRQAAAVVTAKEVPTPLQNSKQTFRAAFGEIGKQFEELKDSVSGVLVPFVTGIEVYERK